MGTGVRELVRQRRHIRQYGIGYYNFWEVGPVPQSWFYRFLQRPALRELAARRRIGLFSVHQPNRWLLPLTPCDRRVFFTGENLDRYPRYADHLLDLVDLSLGFDDLPDANYLRFPLWLVECFAPDATAATITQTLQQWEMHRQLAPTALRKTAAVLIARHDDRGVRGAVADLVERCMPVDYAGAFRNNVTEPLAAGWPAKLRCMQDYRFALCPENSDRTGYVTEKIFHALQAGCLPIYWGSDNCPEPAIINQGAILTYDPEQPTALEERVRELASDEAAYKACMRQPAFQPGAGERIYRYFVDLERSLLTLLQ
ncbi:hypothetical protein LEM8419_02787 [Neolewinella maritima]|uniref:Alpha-(1,3)-fucosyltransferase FucT N-terminal domain-containing protein n=1 Tax=Neolewinella maritima TaxID=1383882 RepID=A0ABN8F5M2_9BACT|nr:glycosyltransferase family 10 [Neolewinella maritima]CAH1001879.1 hypothetical protein LEM8419_02787 [Neolewinella maritima]